MLYLECPWSNVRHMLYIPRGIAIIASQARGWGRGGASKLLHGNAKFPFSKVEKSEPNSLSQSFPPSFYVAQTPWLTLFSFPLCYPHKAWLCDILRGPCAKTTVRRQQMEKVTPSPGLSCCPKHPAAAAAPCLSAPPTAVSSGCLTDSVGPLLSQTDFFFFLLFPVVT